MKVVIFGKGKVGMATDLTMKLNADFHDPRMGHVLTDFNHYDVAFVCVSSLEKGPWDHASIISCLELLMQSKFTGIVAVRCTLGPSLLKATQQLYPHMKLIHFPEFMKQGDGIYLDAPWALVLGGSKEITQPFGEWLVDHGYGNRDMFHFCSFEESALIKLHQNAGLALKVVYANLMYEACQQFGADYEVVRKGVTADVRVGFAHTAVPGEHGFGFNGHCLPKDMACLNANVDSKGLWDHITRINKSLIEKNKNEKI